MRVASGACRRQVEQCTIRMREVYRPNYIHSHQPLIPGACAGMAHAHTCAAHTTHLHLLLARRGNTH